MKPNSKLSSFIKPYDQSIQDLLMEIRALVLETASPCNELIWDNYNAVAIAYSPSLDLKDAFCHIAIYKGHVNLGFNRGAELSPTNLKLEGKGKLIRHLKFKSMLNMPLIEIKAYIGEAKEWSYQLNPELQQLKVQPKSVVKSISEKKIRPH